MAKVNLTVHLNGEYTVAGLRDIADWLETAAAAIDQQLREDGAAAGLDLPAPPASDIEQDMYRSALDQIKRTGDCNIVDLRDHYGFSIAQVDLYGHNAIADARRNVLSEDLARQQAPAFPLKAAAEAAEAEAPAKDAEPLCEYSWRKVAQGFPTVNLELGARHMPDGEILIDCPLCDGLGSKMPKAVLHLGDTTARTCHFCEGLRQIRLIDDRAGEPA